MERIFLPVDTVLETKYPGIIYRVTDQVSQGSSSLIYRVRKSNSDRSVILKELFPAEVYGCQCERSQDGVVRPSGGNDSETAFLRLKKQFLRENSKNHHPYHAKGPTQDSYRSLLDYAAYSQDFLRFRKTGRR